jgi:hypothetical protein
MPSISGTPPILEVEPTAVPHDAWATLTDSEGRKQLVERRIVLPLLHPALLAEADRALQSDCRKRLRPRTT